MVKEYVVFFKSLIVLFKKVLESKKIRLTIKNMLNIVTKSLPPNIKQVIDPLMQVKFGDINIDFSKVKFPRNPQEWKQLGEKIKQDLKKIGKNISIQDAINMAKKIAAAQQKAKAGKQTTAVAPTAKTPATVAKKPAQLEKILQDKKTWLFGLLLLILLLKK